MLNRRVFFWVSKERAARLLGARGYRDHQHTLITVDTESLISRMRDRIELSPINSGVSVPWKRSRGLSTFRRIEDYDFDHWRRSRRGAKKALVELTVLHSVPDITGVTEVVSEVGARGSAVRLWSRE